MLGYGAPVGESSGDDEACAVRNFLSRDPEIRNDPQGVVRGSSGGLTRCTATSGSERSDNPGVESKNKTKDEKGYEKIRKHKHTKCSSIGPIGSTGAAGRVVSDDWWICTDRCDWDFVGQGQHYRNRQRNLEKPSPCL